MNGLGLVLAGGGGKGAYEIGVWKALNEFDITSNIVGVSGASVGALNGALFAAGDFETAKNVWENISAKKVLVGSSLRELILSRLPKIDMPHILKNAILLSLPFLARLGVFTQSGLTELIEENLNYTGLHAFDGSVYATSVGYKGLSGMLTGSTAVKYFSLKGCSDDEIKTRLLASAAIPIVFEPILIDGEIYIDGGLPLIGDNAPIKPLYDEGIRAFVVIHLSASNPVDTSKYPGATIVEIMPSEYLGGSFDGTMNFSREKALKLMELGYCDAVRLLEPLYRLGLANQKYLSVLKQLKENEHDFYKRHIENISDINEVQKSIIKKNTVLREFINR